MASTRRSVLLRDSEFVDVGKCDDEGSVQFSEGLLVRLLLLLLLTLWRIQRPASIAPFRGMLEVWRHY